MGRIALVGSSGRMVSLLQDILQEKGLEFSLWSPKSPPHKKISDFKNSTGVIDFSLPAISEKALSQAVEDKVPYLCGTTGFSPMESFQKSLAAASKTIPVLWDSNFSLGIEILSQTVAMVAEKLLTSVSITDLHHAGKRDAPSGTALRLQKRIHESAPSVKVEIQSIREGENPGEHRVAFAWKDEILEFKHQALSRKPFVLGALKAFEWLRTQPKGLYSMRDLFSSRGNRQQ